MPDTADDSGADGMEVDSAGRLYVATRLGLQVCDQAGASIASSPRRTAVSNVVFGGADFDTLYISSGGGIYKRKLKAKAASSFAAPIKPAAPHL